MSGYQQILESVTLSQNESSGAAQVTFDCDDTVSRASIQASASSTFYFCFRSFLPGWSFVSM